MSLVPVDDLTLTKAVSGLVAAAEALGGNNRSPSERTYQGPCRGLNKIEAAKYVGVNASTFDGMVKAKTLPKASDDGSRLWYS